MKKGQAAMEFLMTYGWAIIVVLITIGALAYFGVLRPERIFGSSCILEPGLHCEDFRVAYAESSGAKVELIIGNSFGVDIENVEVSLDDLSSGVSCGSDNIPDRIEDGASGTYEITCSGITADTLFKATINLKYKKSGFTLERTAIGSISTSVEGSAQCNDKSDNDDDTLIDYPNDPGCVDQNDDDENNCGNELVDGLEECDGTNLNGKICSDLGFTGGTLGCYLPETPNECQFDTSSCTSATEVFCGDTIISSGSYIVNAPVSNYNGNCITIRSIDVELDCQNNQLGGANLGYGIYTDGNAGAELTGITIRNCDITGFDRGMNMEYTDNSFVYDSSFTSNANSGIYLFYSDYNLLSNIEVRGHSGNNDNGIVLQYATNNNLNGGTIDGNYYGIGMAGSVTFNTAFNTITGFYITNNLNRPISIGNADVDNNRFYNNKFSNTNPPLIVSGANNYWNTALTSGINIVGGPWIGGNFWTNPSGTGYSDICSDSDNNGICDVAYQVSGAGNVDSYPLTTYP